MDSRQEPVSSLPEATPNCPVIDNAKDAGATLVEVEGKLRWHFPLSHDDALATSWTKGECRERGKHRLIARSRQSRVINAGWLKTGLLDSKIMPKRYSTSLQQAAHEFLAQKYPDISLDPISQQVFFKTLVEDYRENYDVEKHGVMSIGNRLAARHLDGSKVRLVFPGGQRGNRLYVADEWLSKKHRKASRQKLYEFDTKIEQLNLLEDTFRVAVLTSSGTKIIHTDQESPASESSVIASTSNLDTQGLAHVHNSIDPFHSEQILITDEIGGVWKFGNDTALTSLISKTCTGRKKMIDRWWQTWYGDNEQTLVQASVDSFRLLDLRGRNTSATLLWDRRNIKGESICASGEPRRGARPGIYQILTTEQLIWLDARMPNLPLLSAKHHFRETRGLGIVHSEVNDVPVDMIFQPKTNVILAYSSDLRAGLLTCDAPYLIEHSPLGMPSNAGQKKAGQLIGVQLMQKRHHDDYHMFTLEDQGLVRRHDFLTDAEVQGIKLPTIDEDPASDSEASSTTSVDSGADEWTKYEDQLDEDLLGQYPIANLCRLHKKAIDLDALKRDLLKSCFPDEISEQIISSQMITHLLQESFRAHCPLEFPISLRALFATEAGEKLLSVLATTRGQRQKCNIESFCQGVNIFLAQVPSSRYLYSFKSQVQENNSMQTTSSSESIQVDAADVIESVFLTKDAYGVDLKSDNRARTMLAQSCVRAALDQCLLNVMVFDKTLDQVETKPTLLPSRSKGTVADLYADSDSDHGSSEEVGPLQEFLEQWPEDQHVDDYTYRPHSVIVEESILSRYNRPLGQHKAASQKGPSTGVGPSTDILEVPATRERASRIRVESSFEEPLHEPNAVPTVSPSPSSVTAGHETVPHSAPLSSPERSEMVTASQVVLGRHGDRRRPKVVKKARRAGF